MCVVGLLWKAHPRWRLVMAGNRDEFHARPALPLARWGDPAPVIGGRDLQSGGMWLGVSEEGRCAVVTNIRNPAGPDPDKASRGALVTDWLRGGARPARDALAGFNPFHLFVASADEAVHVSNQPAQISAPLEPGIHMLSNGEVGELWPRKALLEAHMTDWLAAGADDPRSLFDALADEEWPDAGPDQPPVFIRAPLYGTRASTIIAIDEAGEGVIIERSFGADGLAIGEGECTFRWDLTPPSRSGPC